MPKTTTQVGVPGRLRVQDIDQDGYPDFAVSMSFTTVSANSQANSDSLTKSVILMNRKGDDGKRKLTTNSASGDSYLPKVVQMAGEDSSFLTFIDMDDDGKLDFIL